MPQNLNAYGLVNQQSEQNYINSNKYDLYYSFVTYNINYIMHADDLYGEILSAFFKNIFKVIYEKYISFLEKRNLIL